MTDLEKQFDESMINVYRAAKEECGYNATYFLQMLNEKRGIATAKHLLASDGAQYGFKKLWEHGRLDITVECLVLRPGYRCLFDESELETARKRLRQYGYDPSQCEAGQ